MYEKIGKTYYRYSWEKNKKLSDNLIKVYIGEVFSLLQKVEFNRTHISPSMVRLLIQTVTHLYYSKQNVILKYLRCYRLNMGRDQLYEERS